MHPLPRALLVDFYGTLAHGPAFTLRRGIETLVGSLSSDGLPIDADRFAPAYREAVRPYLLVMRQGTETHNTSWVADALAALGIPARAGDPAVVRAVRRYFEAYAEAMEPLPGADASLRALAGRYAVVLVSNFTDAFPVRAAIQRFGWTPLFRGVVISAELGLRKPHPEVFRQALLLAGVPAADAVFVGDDLEEDMAGARKAGLRTVHIRKSAPAALRALLPPLLDGARPDAVIDTFADLPRLVG